MTMYADLSMRISVIILLVLSASIAVAAQDKTIVLVRHAEKAGDADMPNEPNDPALSPAGRERAERLAKFVKKYKPHEIFATNYKRVAETVAPIAKYREKQVQIYDPKNLAEFVQQIMSSKTEHYLIAGHSNTIPPLVNLLAKKEIFGDLVEEEFGVIYVVKIRRGQFKRIEIYEY